MLPHFYLQQHQYRQYASSSRLENSNEMLLTQYELMF